MRTNGWKLTTIALLLGLGAAQLVQTAEADRQPHMRTALITLKKAKQQLDAATPDKGGHRVKAIELVAAAIGEVEAGIKFDNQR
jgi:hypothetical protein